MAENRYGMARLEEPPMAENHYGMAQAAGGSHG